jgi:hypothetical protein
MKRIFHKQNSLAMSSLSSSCQNSAVKDRRTRLEPWNGQISLVIQLVWRTDSSEYEVYFWTLLHLQIAKLVIQQLMGWQQACARSTHLTVEIICAGPQLCWWLLCNRISLFCYEQQNETITLGSTELILFSLYDWAITFSSLSLQHHWSHHRNRTGDILWK